jgi:hypothetical protein
MRLLKTESELQQVNGTSFHNHTFTATPQQLIDLLGEPTYDSNDGEDKVNLEWVCETESGKVFTIYDWKEYRRIEMDEDIEWHVGGRNSSDTAEAIFEIINALD